MILNIEEIVKCISGKLLIKGTYCEFNKISIDTRTINGEDIFLAISGENFDGNKYIFDAIKKGVKLCIIDKNYFSYEEFRQYDVSVVLVDNTLDALKNLAIYVRSKLDIDLIAVTGSVGKTTTKDLIYDLLSSNYKVYKNFGNFNNHLGMPISLVNIDDDAKIGVFEVGMNNLGEIDYLVNILRPHIGIITNIGVSHIEFLKTRENILKAKMEIVNYFNHDDILIVNYEDDLLKSINSSDFLISRVGFSKDYCDMYAVNENVSLDGIKFDVLYNGKEEVVSLPLKGKHNILNSLIAFKLCEIFNIPMDVLRNKFNSLTQASMRQEVINYKNITIINDCYNASLNSMKSAIDILSLYKNERVCILGDMGEAGEFAEEYHREVSNYANEKADKLIAVGKFRNEYCSNFKNKEKCFRFENLDELKNNIEEILIGNETVLIKASRSAKFERVLDIIRDIF